MSYKNNTQTGHSSGWPGEGGGCCNYCCCYCRSMPYTDTHGHRHRAGRQGHPSSRPGGGCCYFCYFCCCFMPYTDDKQAGLPAARQAATAAATAALPVKHTRIAAPSCYSPCCVMPMDNTQAGMLHTRIATPSCSHTHLQHHLGAHACAQHVGAQHLHPAHTCTQVRSGQVRAHRSGQVRAGQVTHMHAGHAHACRSGQGPKQPPAVPSRCRCMHG